MIMSSSDNPVFRRRHQSSTTPPRMSGRDGSRATMNATRRRRRRRRPGDDNIRIRIPSSSSASSSSPFVLALILAYVRSGGGSSGHYEVGHRCEGRLWHPDVTSDSPTCTNTIGDDYPSYWNDPAMKGIKMFDRPQECCDKLEREAPGRDCTIEEADDCVDDVQRSSGNECDHRRWHASKSERDTCTNDNDYPKPWRDDYFLGKTMFLSQDECCGSIHALGAHSCHIINVCTDPTHASGSDSGSKDTPPIHPSGGSGSGSSSNQHVHASGGSGSSSASSSCAYPWHPALPAFDGCSNSPRGTYPNDWNHPDVHHHYLYVTHEDCCNGFFDFNSVGDCRKLDHCREEGPTPSPILPTKYCDDDGPGLKWHRGAGSNECTNDLDYPMAWDDPFVSANHLFGTPEECCARHYSTETCSVVDVCGEVSKTIEPDVRAPPPTKSPTRRPTTRPTAMEPVRPHTTPAEGPDPSNQEVMGCGSKRRRKCANEPKCKWVRNSQSCIAIDATPSVGTVKGQAGHDCDKKYHPTSASERTCTNNDIFPSLWSDMADDYFFATGHDCCAVFYSDGPCEVVNVCSRGNNSAGNKATATTSREQNCRKWHPTSASERACTNSGQYPSNWDESPGKYFFDTGRRCCQEFYGGGRCDRINVC